MGSRRIFMALAAASTLCCAFTAGCGQDDITLPEGGGSEIVGECGSWYPGGGDAGLDEDSDSDESGESAYGSSEGDTLPCFVLDSVRSGEQVSDADPATYANTYLSMGEIYLKSLEPDMSALLEAQFGVTEAKAIIFVFAAENCTACPILMESVSNSREDLWAAGIIPVGVYSFNANSSSQEAFDLVFADEKLMDDGFDAALYRTNDPEHYLGDRSSFPSFPYLTVVRVSDMKVVMRNDPTDYMTVDGSDNPILDVTGLEELLQTVP